MNKAGSSGPDNALAIELAHLKKISLYRRRHLVDGPVQPETIIDGNRVLAFCSNDYLGLANDERLVSAARNGLDTYGLGAGSAHLVAGHTREHDKLEQELAEFTGRARALLFSTGYMANIGIASALLERGDAVFEDRWNHASLLDAGILSGAKFSRFRHADTSELSEKLSRANARRVLVMTDGVFSMDGDMAPLPALVKACEKNDAWLCVDDAHGIGVLGRGGRGSCEYYDLCAEDVPILMGTLGKAFGSFGAFVAGSETVIETLIQKARSYIYTTAPPPAVTMATRAALKIVREESWRRDKLHSLVQQFRQGAKQLGLRVSDFETPIQPLLLQEPERALAASEALLEHGIYVTAIRPPTVPEGTSRLRVTFSAAHETRHVEKLLAALDACRVANLCS